MPLERARRLSALFAAAGTVAGVLMSARPFTAFVVCSALYAAAVLYLVSASKWVRIACVLIGCAGCAICAWLTYSLSDMQTTGQLRTFSGLLSAILMWAGTLTACNAARTALCSLGKNKLETKRAVFQMLLDMECFGVGVLLGTANSRGFILPPGVVLCMDLLILAYIGIGWGYRRYLRSSNAEQARTELLHGELAEQEKRFDRLSAELAVVRRTRHDLNNHLTVVASLLRNGERNKARQYVRSLAENMSEDRAAGGSALALSMSRAKTRELEERGVRVDYPDVQVLTPQQRALVWPWASLMIRVAKQVLTGSSDDVFTLYYESEPLVVLAVFTPASAAEVRRLITERMSTVPEATVTIGQSPAAHAVLVSVLLHERLADGT